METEKTYQEALDSFEKGKNAKGQDKQKLFRKSFDLLGLCSAEQVVQFVEKAECYSKYASRFFWESKIPYEFRKALFKPSRARQLITDYLKHPGNEEHISIPLLRFMADTYPEAFIRVVRQTQRFLNAKHLESFIAIKPGTAPDVRAAIHEWEFINKLTKSYDKKGKYYEGLIINFTVEELLIHFTTNNERQKRRVPKARNNRGYTVMMETNLLRVLERVLEVKYKVNAVNEKPTTQTEFIQKLADNLPPQNTPEALIDPSKLPEDPMTEEKRIFEELIEFYFTLHAFNIHKDLYSYGYIDVDLLDQDEIVWKTTPSYARYKRNDHKGKYFEFYTMNQAAKGFASKGKEIDLTRHKVEFGVQSCIEYFKSLFLPTELIYEQEEIHLERVFELLKTFSEYLMPEGNHVISDGQKTLKVSGFSKKHPNLPKNYLVRFDHKDLIDSIKKIFDWDQAEIKKMVDFLTYDLQKPPARIDLWSRPFIKQNEHLYWCSTFLRDREWSVILQKRITNEQLDEGWNSKAISESQEKALADAFPDGFKAMNSWNYLPGSEEKGEIDVLAYSDKTLFLIELKTTYLTEDLKRLHGYANKNFAQKAAEQLSRARQFIEEYYDQPAFQEVRKELSIDCDFESLTVVPLIVSNSFNADDLYFGDDMLKVSLLELNIILRNDLYWLLNVSTKVSGKELEGLPEISVKRYEQMSNQNAPGFKKDNSFDSSREACNLWKEPDRCSADDFINAIEEDRVWNFLDELWDFSVFKGVSISSEFPD